MSEELTPVQRALGSLLQLRDVVGRNIDGITFHGKRNLYEALGYRRQLLPWDYRSRFKRNAIANRIIQALPKATWRGGGELIEDDSIIEQTEFEKAWYALNTRLNIWGAFMRADILSGLGHYSILLLGTPGRLEDPLEHLDVNDLVFLTPFSEEDALIGKFDNNINSKRFGLPDHYIIRRIAPPVSLATNPEIIGRQVHHTRVLHVSDTMLDDHVFGLPRLECVWNLIDDLEKVTGGGAEAFWKRADQGLQLDIDPTVDFKPETEQDLDKQVERYTHGLERVLKTRGMKITPLGSDVAGFKSSADSIIDQISAGTGIPQRVLMGSEAGHLASTQDRDNWAERVADRRTEFAEVQVVRPFVDRLIEFGALPTPKKYDVRWPEIQSLNEAQKASVGLQWASMNKAAGEQVVTPDEIRDHVLGLPSRGGKSKVTPVEVRRNRGLGLMPSKMHLVRRG